VLFAVIGFCAFWGDAQAQQSTGPQSRLRAGASVPKWYAQNSRGDPEQEYFDDAITDDLTTDLSHVVHDSDFIALASCRQFTMEDEVSVTVLKRAPGGL
jgi:TolB-like protein